MTVYCSHASAQDIHVCAPNPKEEYTKEEISFETVDFKDNQQCLDLLTKRPTGLLHILNDESNFPKVLVEVDMHTHY